MYEFVEGVIESLTPTSVVVVTGGVGYLLQIGMLSYGALEGKTSARLYVHQVLREDANELYGFCTQRERALFRMLISVSGVGPNTGRMLLSAYDLQELVDFIANGDEKALCRVKGIGSKTALRVIVDLQGKMSSFGAGEGAPQKSLGNTAKSEALTALVTLGFARAASEKVLDQLVVRDASASVEQLIKQALRQL